MENEINTELPVTENLTGLIGEFESLKERMKVLKGYIDQGLQQLGVDEHWQDSGGIVYQVVVPKGRFVEFEQIGYARTRKNKDENKGSLGMAKAEDLGYTPFRP